jgi:translation initiation factor 3 subunit M
MSVFVDLCTPEEQGLEVLAFYAKLKGDEGADAFLQQNKKLLSEGNFQQFLSNMVDLQPLVFEKAPEKDIEGCLNVLSSLLRHISQEEFSNLVSKLVSSITSNAEDKPLLRLKLLNTLYNLSDASSVERCDIFLALLKYAEAAHTVEVVIPLFDKIPERLKQWGASPEQAREIYLTARRILKQANKSVAAHEFLLKFLSTFEKADAATLQNITDHAVEATVEAVKIPAVVQLDHLLDMRAIQQLEKSKPQLYALLKLFAFDTLEAFKTFHEANPGFLESINLDYEECLKKIRLLTLATLANQHDEIPFSAISQGLAIGENDVESWVILAISTNILEAKMDQLRRVVVVNRAAQRALSAEQWRYIGERLGVWRNHISSLLEIISQNKV